MQSTVKIGELFEAKYKLAVVALDPVIQKHHSKLAQRALSIVISMEKQIMSPIKKKRRNELHAKNKHKQSGN